MFRVKISRFVNRLFGGEPCEMLSSRAHKNNLWIRKPINAVFFWQVDHCRESYLWEKRQMRNDTEKHHRLPKSRGGTNEPRNISRVRVKYHRAYHLLFGNMNAQEIARVLTDFWIDPDYYLVAVPRNKRSPAGRRKRMYCEDCEAEVLRHISKFSIKNPRQLEEWEFDHSPLDTVPCDNCDEHHDLLNMIEVRAGGVEPINLRFCGENCLVEYKMRRMREGM